MTQDQQPGSLTAVPHQSPGDFQQGTLILNNESSMCLDQNLLDCPDLDDILSCNWVSQQDLEGIYPQEIPDSSNLHYPQHTGYMCGSSNPSNHDATKNISNRNHDITKDASTAIRYRSPAHATGTSNPAGQEPVNSHADPSNSTISRQTLSPTTTVPRRPHQSITTPDFSSVSQCSSSQQSTEASQLSTSQRSTNDIETDVTVASSSAAVPSTTQTEIGANGVPICIPQNTQTLETLLHQSGIPDDEVGEIGWRVLKVLVEFVQIWEKYSAAVERMGDRAGKNMAKVLNSKELCSLNRAICIYQRSNDIGSAQDFGFAAKGTALHGQAVSASTTQETVQPANTSPSLTVPKSLETIVSHSGLTDEEVDEIGWKVLKGLAEFVHLYEKISAAVKEMNDRAKKNIAKILDSKRSHSLSIAIYNYQNSIGIGLTPNLGEV
ncbi:hypothetical protein BDD12DRAFT_94861 [Trichophaea hybrida]|nr:hypothetical protein BDD12DRAFT_94861 [Trichophaea hybrida]